MADYALELKRLPLAAGCRFERAGKGDHVIWSSPITNVRFPVDSRIKSRHTANAVLKQAGMPKKFQSYSRKAYRFFRQFGGRLRARVKVRRHRVGECTSAEHGIISPCVLAVFWLTAISNLVGCVNETRRACGP